MLGLAITKEGRMPRVKHTVEQIITKLREAEVALSRGQTVVQVCRTLGITEQSSGTNCSMERSSRRVGKPRCSSNAGGIPTTRFARTARWAITRRLPRPGNLGSRNAPRLTRDVVQQPGAGQLLDLPLFEKFSNFSGPIAITAAFRRLPAYKKFFQLYRDLDLGMARIEGDFLKMPLARTYKLYELWAFLRVLRAAIKRYNLSNVDTSLLFREDQASKRIATFRSACVIRLDPKTGIAFKRTFKEYWMEQTLCGSFSRTMIPDISVSKVESNDLEHLVILDAKYRVGNQLNDALASLHMYRDSILQPTSKQPLRNAVVAAYLITPFISESTLPWKEEGMPARLFHPEYRTTFKFGAVTLKPGMELTKIGESLDFLLKDAGVSITAAAVV